MKPRSASQSSFKYYPLMESLTKDKTKSKLTYNKKQSTKEILSGRKLSYNKKQIDSDMETKLKVIYDFNKELQNRFAVKKLHSMKSQKSFRKRPSSSNKSLKPLLPKLNTQRKRIDDGILIISQPTQQQLVKMPSFSKIEMVLNVKIQQKKKKFRLKQDLFESLQNQLKQSFKLRILHGKVQSKSPQILNLKKSREKQITKIDQTIQLLNNFTKKYNLKQTYSIQYYPFMNLMSINQPSNREIIQSFSLDYLTQELQRIPGSDFVQQQGTNKAVIVIQSAFKMWQQRKQYLKYQVYIQQIKFIQRYWKRKVLKINFRKEIKKRQLNKLQSFNKIQSQFREKWYLTKNKHKWQIHVPNIGIDEFKKLTMQKLISQQTSQIIRIFKIAHDFLVNIIFVSPVPVNEQVLNYYYKILQIHNISDWANRIRIICPQNHLKFSRTISISRILLESPLALLKIKQIIQNDSAFFVLGQYSLSDIDLAVELNVPIFGAVLQTNFLNTHSGRHTLLKKCQAPTPVVAKDIYVEQELINTLAILMFNNLSTKKWILRIDDQSQGKQEAYINTNAFPMVKTLLSSFKQIKNFEEAYGLQNEMIIALSQQLKANLYNKIRISQKNVYRNTKQYLTTFLVKGGVIQKGIEGQCINVSFLIYPDGQIQIIHAMNVIKSGSRIISSISPIQFTIFNEVQYMVKGIGRQLYNNGVFGYFTLQVLFNHSEQKYYCQGLKCYSHPYSAQAYLCGLINGIQIPKDTNQPQNYMMYSPLLIHKGINKTTIKGLFQKSRLLGIQFDINTKQGVMFLLHDSFQCQSFGIISVSQTYRDMLQRLMTALQFITTQYQGKSIQTKLSAVAMKSKVKLLLNEIKEKEKPKQQNLDLLF